MSDSEEETVGQARAPAPAPTGSGSSPASAASTGSDSDGDDLSDPVSQVLARSSDVVGDDPDDEPNTGGPSAGVQLPPLVARFGQFSINVADVTKALNAALLSDHERRILTETVSRVGDGARFTSDPAALVFGQPREAALGIDPFLCVPPNQIRAGMADGVVAIRREIEAAASTGEQTALDTLECLDYVQLSRAGSSATVCAARVRSLARVECAACSSSPHLVLSFLFSDFPQLAAPS